MNGPFFTIYVLTADLREIIYSLSFTPRFHIASSTLGFERVSPRKTYRPEKVIDWSLVISASLIQIDQLLSCPNNKFLEPNRGKQGNPIVCNESLQCSCNEILSGMEIPEIIYLLISK